MDFHRPAAVDVVILVIPCHQGAHNAVPLGSHGIQVILLSLRLNLLSQTCQTTPCIEAIVGGKGLEGVEVEQAIIGSLRSSIVIHQDIHRRILAGSHRGSREGSSFHSMDRRQAIRVILCPASYVIPFVQDGFRLVVAMRINQFAHAFGFLCNLPGVGAVDVPRKEIYRHIILRHVSQEAIRPLFLPSQGRTANQQVWEAFLQVLGSSRVEVKELLLRAAPCARIRVPSLGIQVRLVPYFPVSDVPFMPIGPSLVVVSDDVLANLCPFLEISGRKYAIFLHVMLNLLPQSEEDLRAHVANAFQVPVRNGKVIGAGIIRLLREVGKDGSDVHRMF